MFLVSSSATQITAYNTVFGTEGVPKGIPFLAAVDWFVGSLRTVTNVTGDAVVCALVAHLCPIDEENMDGLMEAAHLDGINKIDALDESKNTNGSNTDSA
jgi:Na+/H+-dicarboxylate symporter